MVRCERNDASAVLIDGHGGGGSLLVGDAIAEDCDGFVFDGWAFGYMEAGRKGANGAIMRLRVPPMVRSMS